MSRRTNGGFTFVETILALVLIGTGLFGITYLYSNMSHQMYHADLQIIAADLAQQKLERKIAQKAFSGYAAVATEVNEALTVGTYSFTRATTVEYIDPATMAVAVADTGYKRVSVRVTWPGNATGVLLMTLVTNQVPL